MAVILKRSAFIHIPKTGGNYVRAALSRCGLNGGVESGDETEGKVRRNHHTIFEARPTIGDRFTFAFVRHPWGWYRSFWAYRQKRGRRDSHEIDRYMCREFERWVEQVTTHCPGYLTQLYERMLGWPPEVDFLGRTESLTDDMIAALHLAGEEFDEQAIRDTPVQNRAGTLEGLKERAVLSPKIKRLIQASEIVAFERYSYRT